MQRGEPEVYVGRDDFKMLKVVFPKRFLEERSGFSAGPSRIWVVEVWEQGEPFGSY